jgi:hypothetical protein
MLLLGGLEKDDMQYIVGKNLHRQCLLLYYWCATKIKKVVEKWKHGKGSDS